MKQDYLEPYFIDSSWEDMSGILDNKMGKRKKRSLIFWFIIPIFLLGVFCGRYFLLDTTSNTVSTQNSINQNEGLIENIESQGSETAEGNIERPSNAVPQNQIGVKNEASELDEENSSSQRVKAARAETANAQNIEKTQFLPATESHNRVNETLTGTTESQYSEVKYKNDETQIDPLSSSKSESASSKIAQNSEHDNPEVKSINTKKDIVPTESISNSNIAEHLETGETEQGPETLLITGTINEKRSKSSIVEIVSFNQVQVSSEDEQNDARLILPEISRTAIGSSDRSFFLVATAQAPILSLRRAYGIGVGIDQKLSPRWNWVNTLELNSAKETNPFFGADAFFVESMDPEPGDLPDIFAIESTQTNFSSTALSRAKKRFETLGFSSELAYRLSPKFKLFSGIKIEHLLGIHSDYGYTELEDGVVIFENSKSGNNRFLKETDAFRTWNFGAQAGLEFSFNPRMALGAEYRTNFNSWLKNSLSSNASQLSEGSSLLDQYQNNLEFTLRYYL